MSLIAKLPRLRPASDELLHLDLMRFIAAAGIVLHHSHEFFVPVTKSPFLVREQRAGMALFVDLFFFISGFVIAYIYHNRMNSVVDYITFLQRRVGRLVPLHWLTLAAFIAMWSIFVLLHHGGTNTPSFKPKCIAETAFLMHTFISCGRSFNSVTWSISAEMVMYIAFPVIAFIGTRSASLLLGAGAAALTVMMALVTSRHEWNLLHSSWIELSPVLRALPSFVLGAALFYNRSIISRLPAPSFILAVLTAAMITAMVSGVSQLITLLIVYMVAIAAVAADVRGGPPLIVQRFAPLGQLTYSIYMWHMLFISFLLNGMGDTFANASALYSTILVIVCYVSIFTVSYFSFFFIETPARRWIDKISLGPRIPKPARRQKDKALLRPAKRVPRSRNGPGAAVAVAPGLFLAAPGTGEPSLKAFKSMSNVVVVGAQWGDEGKGKIVDWLSLEADVVVRFQGGHNAGHTLVIDHEVYKLTLLPSGILRPGKLSVIGNGVVLDPQHFLDEVEQLTARGVKISPDNLKIAENVPLILALHRELDAHRESSKAGALKIGTTKRGIGPAYEDKVGRRAIRLMDLAEPSTLNEKIERLLAHHEPLRRGLGLEPLPAKAIRAELDGVAAKILPFMDAAWELLESARRAGKRILFEGAQGALLDIDHGTYPFVTSSNTVAANAATGAGLGPKAIGYVLGIAKAYTTRVGGGPFPTELKDGVGELIGDRGREFGTVTGRRRRCGWFDAVLVRQAVKTSGIDGIALTKLDILDGFDEIKVCTGYHLDGKRIERLPASQAAQARVVPIYETIEGWKKTTAGARSWAELPAQAIKYVRRIEELIEAPVALLSTSPERADTILVYDPFRD